MYFTDGLKAMKVTKHSKYCGKSIDEHNIWKLANLKSSEPQQRRFIVQNSIVLHDSVPLINKPLRHSGIGQLVIRRSKRCFEKRSLMRGGLLREVVSHGG